MKLLLSLLCFSLYSTALLAGGKETVRVKTVNGMHVSGESNSSLFYFPNIKIKNPKTKSKTTVKLKDIESATVTKDGEKFYFSRIPIKDNSLQEGQYRSALCQKIVDGGKVSLYLTYSFTIEMGSGKIINAFPMYYLYSPEMEFAKPIGTGGITGRSFKAQALEFFEDDKALCDKIEDKTYKLRHLEDIVVEYNRNSGETAREFSALHYRY